LESKTRQIKQLTDHLLKKYGADNIIVIDYWEADKTAIGLADKTKKYIAYISDKGRADKKFFIALENPPITDSLPYSTDSEFENLSSEEVEEVIIKHLKINR
jgi:hypothetical protein